MQSSGSGLRLSWRVGLAYTSSDEAFDRLLTLIHRHPGIVDEIALFDSVTHHLYVPLDEYAQTMETFRDRMDMLREQAVARVGINVLTTLGHIDEAWSYMPPLPFQPMIGHDGGVSRGCACPNTPELRTYARNRYRMAAQANPQFIWVDDDMRMHNHGVAYACFCPTCLELFARNVGAKLTREELVAALNDPDRPEVRKAWVAQNAAVIASVLGDVSAAIHEVDPRIETGLMTAGPGWITYTGQNFDDWFGALKASKGRPGGGFYADDPRMGIVRKTLDVGRQRASYPQQVTDCQYELENYPYQRFRKSTSSLINECTLALAMGLNGVAFNWLHMWGTSTGDVLPSMAGAAGARWVWERLVDHADGLPTVGLWTAWTWQLMARRKLLPGEEWFTMGPEYDIGVTDVLAHLGIPMCVDAPGSGTVLRGRVVEAFDDEQLRTMLSGGVLMDTTALKVLQDRGLADLTGVYLAHRYDNGAMERFADDELNAKYAGELRDARIEFWGDAWGQADVLEPLNPQVRTLALLQDYRDRTQGPCMTAYENELGGRVVVAGYSPWDFVQSVAKRAQLLNVADWITHDTLPLRLDAPAPLVPVVRMSWDRRRGVIALLNAGLDPITSVDVQVRAPGVPVHALGPEGERQLPQSADDEGWHVTLNRIDPWATVCLLLG